VSQAAARLAQMVGELDSELASYDTLGALLEEQYRMAARMDSNALIKLSAQIGQVIADLRLRHSNRTAELRKAMTVLCRLQCVVPDASLAELQQRCLALQQQVHSCRTLIKRNGELLADQFERVHYAVHGETHTYAPG
jgi:flagellar biosynthesis/type III secretory pathway chaperone